MKKEVSCLKLLLIMLICFNWLSSFTNGPVIAAKADTNRIYLKWALVTVTNTPIYKTEALRMQEWLRAFGLPFDVLIDREVVAASDDGKSLQFANGTVKYQAMLIVSRIDSGSYVTNGQYIKWAVGNGTNALIFGVAVQALPELVGLSSLSLHKFSTTKKVTYEIIESFGEIVSGAQESVSYETGESETFAWINGTNVSPSQVVLNMTWDNGAAYAYGLSRYTYGLGQVWFLNLPYNTKYLEGQYPKTKIAISLLKETFRQASKIPVRIMPWSRWGSAMIMMWAADGVAIDVAEHYVQIVYDNAQEVNARSIPVDFAFLAFGDNIYANYGSAGTKEAYISYPLSSTDPDGYSNLPSVPGYRKYTDFFGGLKIVTYNSTSGGPYDSLKIDKDNDKEFGDETEYPLYDWGQGVNGNGTIIEGVPSGYPGQIWDLTWTGFEGGNIDPTKIGLGLYSMEAGVGAQTNSSYIDWIKSWVDRYDWIIVLHSADHQRRGYDYAGKTEFWHLNGTAWSESEITDRISKAVAKLQSVFGASRVVKVHSSAFQVEVQLATSLMKLGFLVADSSRDDYQYGVFPIYPTHGKPTFDVSSPLGVTALSIGGSNIPDNVPHAMRGHGVYMLNWHARSRLLEGDLDWLDARREEYNETSIWMTNSYRLYWFYNASYTMLRSISYSKYYYEDNQIFLEFDDQSSNLKDPLVWIFPIKVGNRFFESFSDNRRAGKLVNSDREGCFIEFPADGVGEHGLVIRYGIKKPSWLPKITKLTPYPTPSFPTNKRVRVNAEIFGDYTIPGAVVWKGRLTLRDKFGNQVPPLWEQTFKLSSSKNITVTFDVGRLPEGIYTAKLEVIDPESGDILDTGSVSFSVYAPPMPFDLIAWIQTNWWIVLVIVIAVLSILEATASAMDKNDHKRRR